MDGFLAPVRTIHRSSDKDNTSPALVQVLQGTRSSEKTKPRQQFLASSPEEALESLKNEPDYDTLLSILRYLLSAGSLVDIRCPGPLSAQIVQVLVTEIVPNYWAVLGGDSLVERKSSKDLDLLLLCLRSITGLGAVLVRIKTLMTDAKADKTRRLEAGPVLEVCLELLASLLDGSRSVQQVWKASVASITDAAKRRPLAQELVNLIGGGRAVSLVAEAEELLKSDSRLRVPSWLADMKSYSSWLAQNVAQWVTNNPSVEEFKLCADITVKGLRLGYPDEVVRELVTDLLLRPNSNAENFQNLFNRFPTTEQKKVLYAALRYFSERYLERSDSKDLDICISAVAGLVASLAQNTRPLYDYIIAWLTTTTTAALDGGIGIRRAMLAVVAQDRESLVQVLEKSINQFGDQLYIKHTPMLQQEVQTQIMLLAGGYVHRILPMKLVHLMRSSVYLRAISNRLAASQKRAKFLGMVAGEAFSGLADASDKKLNFHMEELDSDEAVWYKGLVKVSDSPGPVDILRSEAGKARIEGRRQASKTTAEPLKSAKTHSLATRKPAAPPKPGFVIEEVESDESDDDDVVPYRKPDSDPEDSDDDPTLVTRDKPKAPVYIRDLIVYLRDTENYDRQKLGLTTAPVLIRRKANFGTEVKDHAEELATLLVGLQDKYDLDDFDNLRLQGMIGLVTAQPKSMGPWFAKTFFDGDYSLSQRASILTVLGLACRELAGFEISEYSSASAFPSKALPAKIEALYLDDTPPADYRPASSLKALPANALDSIAQSLTSTIMAPIAAGAADAVTGPDVLKLSTYTSRLQGKDGNLAKPKDKPRIRSIPNTTAQMIATSFFFPLTGRFQNAVHAASSRTRGILFQPFLLSLYIKTLALLIHAAGPTTLALSEMTTELWSLLLGSSVQAHCAGDVTVTHAVLFALLTLLDVNDDRMRDLCKDMGREVVQTQEWVAQVFENTRGEDAGEENEVKMLAAGILIRLREGIEKYRTLLLGDMIGY